MNIEEVKERVNDNYKGVLRVLIGRDRTRSARALVAAIMCDVEGLISEHDRLTVKLQTLTEMIEGDVTECEGMCPVVDRLTRQLSGKEAEVEELQRERDEFKESYRLAMASVNHAYDKGCEATREKAAGVASNRAFRTGNREGHIIATEVRSMELPERGEG